MSQSYPRSVSCNSCSSTGGSGSSSTHRQRGRMRFALILAVGLTLSTTATPARAEPDFTAPHHPGRVFVRFQPGTPAPVQNTAHAGANVARVLREYRYLSGLRLVEVPDGQVRAAITQYAKNPNVLYAHPDYELHLMGIPDDPGFPAQWALHNTARTVSGEPDRDIDAVQAWDIWESDPNVDTELRIAVLDTGVDYTHPDLASNIWTNPAEAPGDANGDGCPGICDVDDDRDGLIDECPLSLPTGADCSWDDDENGYVDDIHGYDFVSNDGDPMDPASEGHGTKVAGVIGAFGNNGLGITGVIPRCKIVALRIFGGGVSFWSRAIDALDYMIVNGIMLSNNSYGLRVD